MLCYLLASADDGLLTWIVIGCMVMITEFILDWEQSV